MTASHLVAATVMPDRTMSAPTRLAGWGVPYLGSVGMPCKTGQDMRSPL